MAATAGYTAVMSHRSGETEDVDDRRPRRGHRLRPDQDRRALALGPRGEVQPAAADRGGARRRRDVPGPLGLPLLRQEPRARAAKRGPRWQRTADSPPGRPRRPGGSAGTASGASRSSRCCSRSCSLYISPVSHWSSSRATAEARGRPSCTTSSTRTRGSSAGCRPEAPARARARGAQARAWSRQGERAYVIENLPVASLGRDRIPGRERALPVGGGRAAARRGATTADRTGRATREPASRSCAGASASTSRSRSWPTSTPRHADVGADPAWLRGRGLRALRARGHGLRGRPRGSSDAERVDGRGH